MEHFVTLFDAGFLPQGLALHSSLSDHGKPFTLWVLCMDQAAEAALKKIALPNLCPIPLHELETEHPELLKAKEDRTRAEYCWTITPFTPTAVFNRDSTIERVTYVDADVCFFGPPSNLLRELDEAGAHVLITDHAYAPEYIQESTAGRFCVQFLTFRNTREGREILNWWQDRCIEWCYNRYEDGKFGDQKYLDAWPSMWGKAVRILQQVDLTLAPWNVHHLLAAEASPKGMFHFHGLRSFKGGRTRFWCGYLIPKKTAAKVYLPYLERLRHSFATLQSHSVCVPQQDGPHGLVQRIKQRYRNFTTSEGWANI